MKMSDEKKKEVLISAFDLFMLNYEEHHSELRDIVVKMFEYDIFMGLDMWKDLLREYGCKGKEEEHDSITSSVVLGLQAILPPDFIDDLVLSHPEIKKAFFEYPGMGVSKIYAAQRVGNIIDYGELEVANELLELLYNNISNTDNWNIILLMAIPNFPLSDEAYDLLDKWAEKIEDESERAAFRLEMLKHAE